jgi:hypothetical protein
VACEDPRIWWLPIVHGGEDQLFIITFSSREAAQEDRVHREPDQERRADRRQEFLLRSQTAPGQDEEEPGGVRGVSGGQESVDCLADWRVHRDASTPGELLRVLP